MDYTILIIAASILAAYLIFIIVMEKKGWFKPYNLSLMGPILVWRTQRGRGLLEKLSKPKRFWRAYGTASIIINILAMIFMVALIIWQTWAITGFTEEQKEALPGAEFALVLPGINPILPLDFLAYIVIALIVAMIIHEFSHGIQSLVHDIKVKSLGIMAFIVPLGAFCEPDEEQLTTAKPKPRMKIYSAGPTSNFIVVLISLMLLSLMFISSVSIASEGPGVFGISEDTPADLYTEMKPGDIITSIDNATITNTLDFHYLLQNSSAGENITITYQRADHSYTSSVILANRYDYTQNETDNGTGYLGVVTTDIHKGYLQILKNPLTGFPDGLLLLYILPLFGYFQGYNPIVAPFTNSFVITGALSFIPDGAFWAIINTLYWIFWLNLAVGIFNVLPMVPLDGGYIFNDAISIITKKLKPNLSEERRQKLAKTITIFCSFFILFLVFFPWFVKYF